MRKQGADGLAVVDATDGLAEDVGDIQDFQLGAFTSVVVLWHRVCHNHLVHGGGVDARDRIAAENAVSDQGIDSGGALFLQQLRRSCQRVCRIGQIIHQDADTTTHVAHQHHGSVLSVRDLGRAALLCRRVSGTRDLRDSYPYLVNQGKSQAQIIRNGSSTLCATRVWTDDDCLLETGDRSLDVPLQEGLAVEVVNGDVEKSLVSARREVSACAQSF